MNLCKHRCMYNCRTSRNIDDWIQSLSWILIQNIFQRSCLNSNTWSCLSLQNFFENKISSKKVDWIQTPEVVCQYGIFFQKQNIFKKWWLNSNTFYHKIYYNKNSVFFIKNMIPTFALHQVFFTNRFCQKDMFEFKHLT